MDRMMLLAAALLAVLALSGQPAPAESLRKPPARSAALPSELSSQHVRPRTRLRVYPGRRLLYRDCNFHLAQEWRPSGTVIVPRLHCWWVRG
jgi:hypothetical protein